jgi:2-polyprenyl-6-hydroxyphenyl methylase/3-demethylubiquinone-9 3-methyltransferase
LILTKQLMSMKKFLKHINHSLKTEIDPAFRRRSNIILNQLNIQPIDKVLDAGCGRGFYSQTISTYFPKIQLHSIDINRKYLTLAKKRIKQDNIKFKAASITNLPYPNNYFDKIIASEVLEHIVKEKKAIKEIYRTLKPGGICMISVPNANYPFLWDPLNWTLEKLLHSHVPPHIWWLAGIWADHQRLYSKKELVAKLKNAGFKIKKRWQNTHYCIPFSHFLFYAIGKNLVEKGLLPDFNRFEYKKKQSVVNKIILWPINAVDKLNANNTDKSSVNLIVKITK